MRVSRIRVWVLGLRSLFCSKGYAACSQGVGVDSEGSRWVSAVTRDVNSSTLVRTNSWRRRSTPLWDHQQHIRRANTRVESDLNSNLNLL